MYAYAAASTTATMLSPLAAAPATTNPAGLASGAITAGGAAAGDLQRLATQAARELGGLSTALSSTEAPLVSEFQSGIGEFAGLLGMPLSRGAGTGTSGLRRAMAPSPVLGAPMQAPGAVPRPAIPVMERPAPEVPTMRAPQMPPPARLMPAAAMGQATPVGRLSVPSSWSAATPEVASSSAAPLASAAAAPMLTPRGIPAGQVGGMEARAFSAPMPARASVLPRVIG